MSAALTCALLLHLGAYHVGPDVSTLRHYTPGVGLVCPVGELEAAAGVYRNSWGDASAYVAIGQEPVHLGVLQIGAFAGVVSGYGDRVRAMAGLQSSMPFLDGRLRLQLVPKPSRSTDMALGLAYQINF